jgi:signal transduction histidine kinase
MRLTFTGVIMVAVIIVGIAASIFSRLGEPDGPDHFTRRFFSEPNGLVNQLANYYTVRQSWDGVETMLVGAQSAYFRPDALFLADNHQRLIYFVEPDLVGQPFDRLRPALVLPVQVKGQTVGFLGTAPFPNTIPRDRRPMPFTQILGQWLLVISVVGGGGGIVFGVMMSRTLTAPLNNLAEAARAIGARHLNRRVPEKGTAEMVSVARAFNEMAAGLEQAEQLRRNLLADVAHELRTPLSVLQGNLRAILDEVYPMNQEEIARLYEHSRFLSRLVNDLHELAQAEARQLPLDFQSTTVGQLVKSTVDTFRPNTEAKQIAVQLHAPDGLPPVQADPARLRQVLQNLLANALRHTPENGQITVTVAQQGHGVAVVIADTGDGIAPEHLPHIFDRFYRADLGRSRDRGGAGLGLAIARAIIDAHSGRLSAASQGVPGQGSAFTVWLPCTPQ